MQSNKSKTEWILLLLFMFISFITIIDYFTVGQVEREKIVDINNNKETYYNAEGNYHYSYSITTDKNAFPVSEKFSQGIEENDSVKLEISPIFRETNSYESNGTKETYSLRVFSGLYIPLFMLFVGMLSCLNIKVNLLTFVVSCLSFINLIYLIF